MISLYEGAKTRVREEFELSQVFEVKVEMHQGSPLSPVLFAVGARNLIFEKQKWWSVVTQQMIDCLKSRFTNEG